MLTASQMEINTRPTSVFSLLLKNASLSARTELMPQIRNAQALFTVNVDLKAAAGGSTAHALATNQQTLMSTKPSLQPTDISKPPMVLCTKLGTPVGSV